MAFQPNEASSNAWLDFCFHCIHAQNNKKILLKQKQAQTKSHGKIKNTFLLMYGQEQS